MIRVFANACGVLGLTLVTLALFCAAAARSTDMELPPVAAILMDDPQDAAGNASAAALLRRFTPEVKIGLQERVSAGADVTLLLGSGHRRLTPSAIAALRFSKRIVAAQYHLAQLRNAGIAFGDVRALGMKTLSGPALLKYRTIALRTDLHRFEMLSVRKPARVLAWITAGSTRVPYAISDGNAVFLNGPLRVNDRSSDAPAMAAILADILNRLAFERYAEDTPHAAVAITGVTARTPAIKLFRAIRYLQATQTAYVVATDDSAAQGGPELAAVLALAAKHGRVVSGGAPRGNAWLPWLRGDLGEYADVDRQLAAARVLRACGPCIAWGDFDAQYTRFDDLRRYVESVRSLGYRLEGDYE